MLLVWHILPFSFLRTPPPPWMVYLLLRNWYRWAGPLDICRIIGIFSSKILRKDIISAVTRLSVLIIVVFKILIGHTNKTIPICLFSDCGNHYQETVYSKYFMFDWTNSHFVSDI